MKKIILFLILFCSLQTFGQVIPVDILDRINHSTYIFEGQVIRTDAYWTLRHEYIYTSVTVDIKKILKGQLICGTIELILLGGQVGNEFLEISHNLVLSKGERGVFMCQETDREHSLVDFYQETNDIVLQTTSNEQGFIEFHDDDINKQVIDYQFSFDSLAQVYNLMELYTQLYFVDCYPSPSNISQSNTIQRTVSINTNPPENIVANSLDTTLTVTLINPQVTHSSGADYFEFDLALSDNQTNIYFTSTYIHLSYDTLTFGSNIDFNSKVTITAGSILQDTATYRFTTSDFDAQTFTAVFGRKTPSFNPNFIDLSTVPQIAAHFKIEIEDCNHNSMLNTFQGVLNSVYAFQPTVFTPNSIYANHINDSISFAGCGSIYINSISPSSVRGGVGDIVTITGAGFGSVRGTGNVFLKNANNGGSGAYIHLDSVDYLPNGWTDTEIKFIMPSIVDSSGSNKRGACPGSGLVKILTNSGDSVNSSNDYITIDYSISNSIVFDPLSKHMINLTVDSTSTSGVFLFRTDTSFSNYPDRMACLSAAMQQWRCLTGVNFRLGTDTIMPLDTITIRNDVSYIKVGYSPDSSALAYTQQWGLYSGGSCNIAFTREVDLIVNRLFLPYFFVDTNRVDSVPIGQYDFYNTLLHEFGHAHSLRHVNDPNAIMWWQSTHAGVPAIDRKIFLMNDPMLVAGGNYVTAHSFALNAACPIFKMSLGTSNCTGAIGITEINKPDINLNIYPNPTESSVNVSYDVEKHSRTTFTIFDLAGRQVYFKSLMQMSGSYKEAIPVESFDNGYYLLYLSINQYQYAGKLIKQ